MAVLALLPEVPELNYKIKIPIQMLFIIIFISLFKFH